MVYNIGPWNHAYKAKAQEPKHSGFILQSGVNFIKLFWHFLQPYRHNPNQNFRQCADYAKNVL
jgi:hypothetical protein